MIADSRTGIQHGAAFCPDLFAGRPWNIDVLALLGTRIAGVLPFLGRQQSGFDCTMDLEGLFLGAASGRE
jgi:hypothetical protein